MEVVKRSIPFADLGKSTQGQVTTSQASLRRNKQVSVVQVEGKLGR